MGIGTVKPRLSWQFRDAQWVENIDDDGDDASDDAVLIERHGGTVVTVAGDPANLKVTFPEDLAIVEAVR